ncbi:hypothetical protein GW916_03320 [bacterium]|nr:hypothetical protein [bacterium]
MKFFSKAFLGLTLLFSVGAMSAEENITLIGQHLNEDYIFVLNPVWEDVQGSWGRSQYNLEWDDGYKIIKGETARVSQKVSFDEELKQIYGDLGCGWVDLFYTLESPWLLNGRFCLDDGLRLEFSTEAEMKSWVEEKVSTELSIEFPEPARAEVQGFLKKLINF